LVFSEPGRYEDFPPRNKFVFASDNYAPITTLHTGIQVGEITEGAAQRLVVGKDRSCSQVRGTGTVISREGEPFEDFAITPLHPATGILAKRSVSTVNGVMVAMTQQGLEILDNPRPVFIGRRVRLLLKDFYESQDPARLEVTQLIKDSLNGFIILAYKDTEEGGLFNNKLLLVNSLPRLLEQGVSVFSTIGNMVGVNGLPLSVVAMHETLLYGKPTILLSTTDQRVYKLFTGQEADGAMQLPVIATAETQELPQDDKASRKLFRHLRLEKMQVRLEDQYGSSSENLTEEQLEGPVVKGIDTGWKIAYSVDSGRSWTPDRQLYTENLIGLVGKTLMIRFTHNGTVPDEDVWITLSGYQLFYNVIGDAR
jgi:hypothetical protein